MDAWIAPDLTEDTAKAVSKMTTELFEMLPVPAFRFENRDQVEAMTDDQALLVVHYTRRLLAQHLLSVEYHCHMTDDCGDYLDAATEMWSEVFEASEVVEGGVNAKRLAEYLLTADMKATDGDIRAWIFTDGLYDAVSV